MLYMDQMIEELHGLQIQDKIQQVNQIEEFIDINGLMK